MESNKYSVPLAIIVAGALVAGAIYFGGSTPPISREQASSPQDRKVSPVTDKDHIVGSRTAPVIVVEYSDLECPFCKIFHSTMREIVREYEGQVAWVYRHFPIVQLHARAPKEAEATECAAELGGNLAFWSYVDKIFEITPSNDGLDPAELPKIAQEIGLDMTGFNSCLSSGRYRDFVERSVEEAITAGALGTPYSVIIARDGRQAIVNGAEPIERVRAKIDSLLEN